MSAGPRDRRPFRGTDRRRQIFHPCFWRKSANRVCLQVGEENPGISTAVCVTAFTRVCPLLLRRLSFFLAAGGCKLPNLREMAARLSYRMGAAAYAPFPRCSNRNPGGKITQNAGNREFLKKDPGRCLLVFVGWQPSCRVPSGRSGMGLIFNGCLERFALGKLCLEHPAVSLSVDETCRSSAVTARVRCGCPGSGGSKRSSPLESFYRRYLGQSTPAMPRSRLNGSSHQPLVSKDGRVFLKRLDPGASIRVENWYGNHY